MNGLVGMVAVIGLAEIIAIIGFAEIIAIVGLVGMNAVIGLAGMIAMLGLAGIIAILGNVEMVAIIGRWRMEVLEKLTFPHNSHRLLERKYLTTLARTHKERQFVRICLIKRNDYERTTNNDNKPINSSLCVAIGGILVPAFGTSG